MRLAATIPLAALLLAFSFLSGCPQQPDCGGHSLGEQWIADDNCNTCTCTEHGTACTEIACEPEDYCEEAADCEEKDLAHIMCVGHWECENNKCAWKCEESDAEGTGMTEMEAKEIAERYVRKMGQYRENTGINLKTASAEELECKGCWALKLEFDFLTDENAKEVKTAYALVEIREGEVAEHAISTTGSRAVEKGNNVKVHYVGTLDDGTEFDSSLGKEPLEFEAGAGEMIGGFDAAVIGMEIGEEKNVRLPPEEAYGEYNPALVMLVPRKQIVMEQELEAGLMVALNQPDGTLVPATILDFNADFVRLDLNPPLAGKALNFWIKVVEISG